MPISLKNPSSWLWNDILGKIAKNVHNWGARWLNLIGKIVLIKVILSSLTIFQCATLFAPKGVLEKISKSTRSFL
jgi:hypothetical protein